MMQPFAKLIRQIRDATTTNGSAAPVESLAAEYTRLCDEANQRLDSCAVMLEKGSEYQALQLAETEPVLLDLIATLSFAEAPDWVAYCAAHQLPAPQKFDAKAVQALDRLYAKGISANHPLYREYRAAISSRDDAKAIQIIRSIVRLSPDDANARSELARNENKLFQLKLQELRAVLGREDEPGILATLAELDRVAPASRLAELPEYARAAEIRHAVERREAIAVAERLVGSLEEEREAGAWRMVGDLLARLRELQSEHGFALPESAAARCAQLQEYFDAERAAAEESARFERAMATLGGLAEKVDSRLHSRSKLPFSEAQALESELKRLRAETEKFERGMPEDLEQRVSGTAKSLHAELVRLRRQRRWMIAGGSAAALVAIAAASWVAVGAMRAQDYTVELSRLREAGHVDAAEKILTEARKETAALAAQPRLSARLAEIDHWIHEERAKLADVNGQLAELETSAKAGAASARPIDVETKVGATNDLIDSLASDLRAGPAGRMLAVRKQFEQQTAITRNRLSAWAETELTDLESLAGARLGYDQSKESLTEALGELEPRLKSLEACAKPEVTALALPAVQQARVIALRRRADLFHDELDALAKTSEALLQATTLDAFLHALGGYKASRLVQAREVSEARKLLITMPKLDDLLAGLLLPGDPLGWAAAKDGAAKEGLTPENVLPAEIGRLVALRDDIYVNDIWEVTFLDFHRKSERRDLYARGEMKKEGPNDAGGGVQTTRWIGAVYDPGAKAETPAFTPTTITMQKTTYGGGGDGEVTAQRLSPASEFLSRLELNRLTDSYGSKFERPLLSVFDLIARDKAASPILKAYFMQQLGMMLKVRPYAWGLEYCASLYSDLAELDRLCDGTALRSQDWLLDRKKEQLRGRLTPFFTGLQDRGYLTEARLRREVVRRVMKAGLQYGGFRDSLGQAHLLGEARGSTSLWALAEDETKLVRYQPDDAAQKGKAKLAGFSPILFVPLDRAAVLADVGRNVTDQPAGQIKWPAIPWLEIP